MTIKAIGPNDESIILGMPGRKLDDANPRTNKIKNPGISP
jgi:hypothetical protein